MTSFYSGISSKISAFHTEGLLSLQDHISVSVFLEVVQEIRKPTDFLWPIQFSIKHEKHDGM